MHGEPHEWLNSQIPEIPFLYKKDKNTPKVDEWGYQDVRMGLST